MTVNRKLVAVVMADVVGYSRLMERDEAGTHQRLTVLHRDVIAPTVARHGGRTVDTAGDSMLLEFASATAALRCAIEIQRAIAGIGRGVDPSLRMELRVGVNLGDIIVDGDRIAGDGINVAARLESLAEPGGICVAGSVVEQLRDDLGVELIDRGVHAVKNITRPVRVFSVALAPDGAASRAFGRARGRPARPRSITVAGALASIVAVATVVVISHPWRQSDATPDVATSATGASVVVMPFTAVDARLQPNAQRLASDVTLRLADGQPDLRVAQAQQALAAADGAQHDPFKLAQNANVRYVLEGDVRSTEGKITVSVRILDASQRRQIDATRAIMEEATFGDREAAIRQVAPMARSLVKTAMQRAAAEQGTMPTTAQGLVDRARALAIPQLLARAQEVHRLADAATRLDPTLAAAWAQRADSAIDLFLWDFTSDRARLLAEADVDSLKAVTIEPRDAEFWSIRAQLLGLLGNINAALEARDRARELDPTRLYPILVGGWVELQAGRTDEAARAVSALRQVIPHDAGIDLLDCTTKLFAGAYAAAVPLCERSSAASPDAYVYAHLAAAHAMNGDVPNAIRARAALLRTSPEFTLARYEAKRLYSTPEGAALERAHLIAGLRKAGVPE